MAGVSRKPALSFGVKETMVQLNLVSFEVSPVEPLHDLKRHIKNMWEILPQVLSNDVKCKFLSQLEVALGKSLLQTTYQ